MKYSFLISLKQNFQSGKLLVYKQRKLIVEKQRKRLQKTTKPSSKEFQDDLK